MEIDAQKELLELKELISSWPFDVNDISKSSAADFAKFLGDVHKYLIIGESPVRTKILRYIRLGLASTDHYDAFLKADMLQEVIAALERDSACTLERMQALKLIRGIIVLAPEKFPISFARSLVAIVNYPQDNIRRVCMETLRELLVVNPEITVRSGGLSSLLEAAIEPSMRDMAEPILVSYLYLLNTPTSRQYLRPCMDLRVLMSPFTDLDGTPDELKGKWAAASAAFLGIMRNWAGMATLATDPLGLTTLVTMLKDRSVTTAVQEVLLDVFSQVFIPFTAKARRIRGKVKRSFEGAWHDTLVSMELMHSPGDTGVRATNYAERPSEAPSALYALQESGDLSDEDSEVAKVRTSTTSGTSDKTETTEKTTASEKLKRAGFSMMNALRGKGGSSNQASNATTTRDTESTVRLSATPPVSSSPLKKNKFYTAMTSSASRFSNMGTGGAQSRPSMQTSRLSTRLDRESFMTGVVQKDSSNTGSDDFDPLYNLLDNYAALLCLAFLHSGIIDALTTLGTRGDTELAKKARQLMLDILGIISRIFPESFCSELLTLPSLIELSTTPQIQQAVGSEHKASQILLSLADAFTVMPHAVRMHRANTTESAPTQLYLADRHRSNSGGATTGAGLPSQVFKICNVKDIRDLSKEMKSTGRYSALNAVTATNTMKALSSKHAMLQDLNLKLIVSIDKNEFKKQMSNSRVIGNEGKEPFKWDWLLIQDMLGYSFTDSDRLIEALETKWIRRVSGFYRCASEEKGYFANLDWEPSNMFYVECATDLYQVLMTDERGMAFMGGDRRGMLFVELNNELQQLMSMNGKGWSSNPTALNVFRFTSTTQSMAREFFTIMGRMCIIHEGRKLLDGTRLFDCISQIGAYEPLDYVSRAIITGLAFSDNGFMSRHLMEYWSIREGCSSSLTTYMLMLLLTILRSQPQEFLRWGIDFLIKTLENEDIPSQALVKVLEESLQDHILMRAIITSRPRLVSFPDARRLQMRMAACPEGLEWLKSKTFLQTLMKDWKESQCKEYVGNVEGILARQLCNTRPTRKAAAIVVPVVNRSGVSYEAPAEGDPLAGQSIDVEGLLRIPWNIEVKIRNGSGGDPTAGVEYLRVDAYLDSTSLPTPVTSECCNDDNRIVKIRGMVLDSKGYPTGYPVSQHRIITSTLAAGTCPVMRDGKIVPITAERENRPVRRRGSTTDISYLVDGEPLTSNLEEHFDWSTCKPDHRRDKIRSTSDDLVVCEFPEEPVTWVFSKTPPSGAARDSGVFQMLYLVEVHYNLRLETGTPTFVPIPRHLYSQLGRTAEGLTLLTEMKVIQDNLAVARNDLASAKDRRVALWALGHIGSTDPGCAHLIYVDSNFIDWLVEIACTASNYSIRGTAFYALGLISRSKKGMRQLQRLQWDCASQLSNSAVAFPRDISALFRDDLRREDEQFIALGSPRSASNSFHSPLKVTSGIAKVHKGLTANLDPTEIEVINLISRMPGVIVYNDSKMRLERIRAQKPDTFLSRNLYLAVCQLLETCTFKLNARRDVMAMFKLEAKLKPAAK